MLVCARVYVRCFYRLAIPPDVVPEQSIHDHIASPDEADAIVGREIMKTEVCSDKAFRRTPCTGT
jgi:hypothetical protein